MFEIIRSESYAETMARTVEPFLAARRTELRLDPRGGDPRGGGSRGGGSRGGVPRGGGPLGGTLYCARYDASDAVGTVVICHGFTETAEKYYEVIYYLLTGGYHVYVPEHCGHGHSYRLVEDLSLVHIDRYERYVEDFLAAADAAKQAHPELPLLLYAHSMGGGIGAAALATQPTLFARAVLTSPMIQPLTGGFPWPAAKALAALIAAVGMTKRYAPGHHAYDGNEPFESSASTGRTRFDYYQRKRSREPLYQMNGASCGWVHEAARLNRFLMTDAPKRIQTPILLFQSEHDYFVSNEAQERFVRRIPSARLCRIPAAKHEIFNARDEIVQDYWPQVFRFFAED